MDAARIDTVACGMTGVGPTSVLLHDLFGTLLDIHGHALARESAWVKVLASDGWRR